MLWSQWKKSGLATLDALSLSNLKPAKPSALPEEGVLTLLEVSIRKAVQRAVELTRRSWSRVWFSVREGFEVESQQFV